MIRTLYPSLVNPLQPQEGPDFNPWIRPWSEPVRHAVLAVALIASATVLGQPPAEATTVDRYQRPFSEPIFQRGLRTADQQFLAWSSVVETVTADKWIYPWSEPVRLKQGLGVTLQQFTTPPETLYPILSRLTQWYEPLNEPVRLKTGLGAHLQESLAFTALKPAFTTVTITMNALETNRDVALFGVLVYNVIPTPYVLIAGANVDISEIPATRAGAASIEET